MARTKQQLKIAACEAIERNREKIIALGDSIFAEPELGYKEFKTAAKIKRVFDELGYEYRDGVAITGVIAPRKGKESKLRVAIMGELDAVVVPDHPSACKETGAAHACGHHGMMAALAGVAYALAGTGIMEELSGDIVLMAVPAEEYVELAYRNSLREAGKIAFLGGKQEFIRLGEFDDIDAMLMQHIALPSGPIKAGAGARSNGFTAKLIRYIGQAAHAGAAPFEGINALNAANLGLMAIHAQRETFRDEDHIRVHPIITKGGTLVNIVPDDVRMETYVRGANVGAILDASAKVNRALVAGGDAVGAKTVITELPGYLPENLYEDLMRLGYENLKTLMGEEAVSLLSPGFGGGSSDAGDVSCLIPAMQAFMGGAEGGLHSESFRVADKEIAFINAAKMLVMTAIDLLADGAETGLAIKSNFKPIMTKQQYLTEWGHLSV